MAGATIFVAEAFQQKRPIAVYPPAGTTTFAVGLMSCCDGGPHVFAVRCGFLALCPCLFLGGLFSKAGESFLHGCCTMGAGLALLRTTVRRHYGIAQDGCPDLGCGSDFTTVCCCCPCAAIQLDRHLDQMAREGTSAMTNGVSKS